MKFKFKVSLLIALVTLSFVFINAQPEIMKIDS